MIYRLHIHRHKKKKPKIRERERERERNWKWGLWRKKWRCLTWKQRRRWWRSWETSFWVVRLGAMSGEWHSWKTLSRCLRIVNKISSKLFTLTSASPSSSPQSTRLFHNSMNAQFVLCFLCLLFVVEFGFCFYNVILLCLLILIFVNWDFFYYYYLFIDFRWLTLKFGCFYIFFKVQFICKKI